MVAALSLTLGAGWASPARYTPSPDWGLTALHDDTRQLSAAADRTLSAWTPTGLYQSPIENTYQIGGKVWNRVPLPPEPAGGETYRALVTVDPSNASTIYTHGAEGLYKSSDRGGAWQLILPTDDRLLKLSVSPADPSLLYLALARGDGRQGALVLLRSRDGGTTWNTLPEARLERCVWVVTLLETHPAYSERLFVSAGCADRPGLMNTSLLQSGDQGERWSALPVPASGAAWRMVGGRGVLPGRFYLDMSYSTDIASVSSAVLLRSDDDGVTWDRMLSKPGTAITGLAYDALAPEWVYVSLRKGGVLTSRDGGRTWSPSARQDVGEVSSLVIPIGTRDLYAATGSGVWSLRLPI
jgi:photosystem II stability/assembly factor-like uncharacterized protein